MKILKNAIQCKLCQSIIISKHRHDFVSCECGAVCVDGGHDYLRRVGDYDSWIELSEVVEAPNTYCVCGHPINNGKCINSHCEEDRKNIARNCGADTPIGPQSYDHNQRFFQPN